MVSHLVNRVADLENTCNHQKLVLKQFDPLALEKRQSSLETELVKLKESLREAVLDRLPEDQLPAGLLPEYNTKISEKCEMQIAAMQEGLLKILMDGLLE